MSSKLESEGALGRPIATFWMPSSVWTHFLDFTESAFFPSFSCAECLLTTRGSTLSCQFAGNTRFTMIKSSFSVFKKVYPDRIGCQFGARSGPFGVLFLVLSAVCSDAIFIYIIAIYNIYIFHYCLFHEVTINHIIGHPYLWNLVQGEAFQVAPYSWIAG